MPNTLYYGDNLTILREHIADASVDLIYLDPPFNSSRNYNLLFKDETGQHSEAQITAFEDTWHWNQAAALTYNELVTQAPDNVSQVIAAMRQIVKDGPMLAYLVMMAARLIELHRVLKPTGSLYLHCDPTASSQLRMILDAIFGPQCFRSEIIWKRTSAHSSAKRYGPVHDVIWFYTKSDRYTWNPQHETYDPAYLASHYRNKDDNGRPFTLSDLTGAGVRYGPSGQPWRGFNPAAKGRHWSSTPEELDRLDAAGRIYWPAKGWPRYIRYLDEVPGTPLQDVWTDIDPINAKAVERLGYPTQKPLPLLERILCASSNTGDVVLDPFCGCGTAVAAAQRLGRQWIGIDITHLAIALIKYRMEAMYPSIQMQVIGEPKDVGAAQQLAKEDRYQFQWWALSLVYAKPIGGQEGSRTGKKGSDKGMDGVINFVDDASGQPRRVIVQVKSGNVKSGDIRDLAGVVQREKAAIGVFITLQPPTKDMLAEAASADFYHSDGWGKDYPRLQILSIADLLHGKPVQMPPAFGTFKQAPIMKADGGQAALEY